MNIFMQQEYTYDTKAHLKKLAGDAYLAQVG
jgi:hypothetical protein